MFRAIVVDDEPKVRRGLSSLIPQLDPEWTVIGEAKNGIEAIELVKRDMPDLVITDIRMPQMNGLDLLSALKEYPVHVVILSGYGFFEYAQTAVKFGAFDYLLKPVKPPEIQSVLSRVKEQRQGRTASETAAPNAHYYAKRWKEWLLQEEDAPEHQDKLREQLPAGADRFRMMAVEIDRYDELIMEDQWGDKQLVSFAVRNVIHEVLTEMPDVSFLHLFTNGNQLFYLIWSGLEKSEDLKRLIGAVKKWVKISISIGLSGTGPDFDTLPSLCRQAVEALQNKWIYGDGIVCRYDDLSMNGPEKAGYPSGLDEAVIRAIRSGDKEAALGHLSSFLQAVIKENVSFRLFHRFGLQLLSSVYRIVYEHKIQDILMKEIDRPQDMFHRDFTADEYLGFMSKLITAVVSALEWGRRQRNNKSVDKAVEFIRRNYAKDISLEDVAHHVRMNGSYFSSFFKQETGDNFVEYLTRFRMEKAKSLMMDSELRLYEISQLVGYQDVKYFSRLFKRQAGVTPAEYRQFFYRKED